MDIILASPVAILTLVGLLIIVLAFVYMSKVHFTVRMLSNIGLMLALALILEFIRVYHVPQGGSVTLGSMVPLILIALRYGTPVGMLAGFVFGILNFFQDPYIVHPLQVLFDYPLPYMVLGLAGLFPQHKLLGTTIAITMRFLCHVISGAVFFASYAPEGMNPYYYSIIYNGSYLIPDLIICLIILKVLPINRFLNAMK